MHRLFVAIRPPESIIDILVDAMGDGATLRWVPSENIHLTLRFIGEVERPAAEDLATMLGIIRCPSISLKLGGVGQFSWRGGGALWAGVEPRDPLHDLAAKIERICVNAGLEPERRAFHPHITIARWSGRPDREVETFLARNVGLRSPTFDVGSFILFESRLSRHGANYEVIAEYPVG